jgi:hypothetical protein
VSPLESNLLDAVVRLVKLGDAPGDAQNMQPVVTRKVVYRIPESGAARFDVFETKWPFYQTTEGALARGRSGRIQREPPDAAQPVHKVMVCPLAHRLQGLRQVVDGRPRGILVRRSCADRRSRAKASLAKLRPFGVRGEVRARGLEGACQSGDAVLIVGQTHSLSIEAYRADGRRRV